VAAAPPATTPGRASKWDIPAPAGSAPSMGMVPITSNSGPAIDALLTSNPSLADGPVDASGQLLDLNTADVSMKIHLHNDVVHALLSHDGATLTTIRSRTSSRIKILPPAPGDLTYRDVQLGGTNEDVCGALGLILAEMHKSCASNPNVCTVEKINTETIPSYTLRCLVAPQACGSIIGKGGAVILGIRSKSNAIVKVEELPFPDAPERPISIVGPVERVHVAILEIVGIIATFTKQLKAKGVTPGSAGAGGGGASRPPEHQGAGFSHMVPSTVAGKLIGQGARPSERYATSRAHASRSTKRSLGQASVLCRSGARPSRRTW